MTLDQLMWTSVPPQLVIFSGWRWVQPYDTFNITTDSAFQLLIDRTDRTKVNPLGADVEIDVMHLLVRVSTARGTDAVANEASIEDQILGFTAGGYLPPAVSVGDLARIDALTLATMEPPRYENKGNIKMRNFHLDLQYTVF